MRGLRLLIGKARHTHTQTASSFSRAVVGNSAVYRYSKPLLSVSFLAIFVDVVLRSASFT